MKIAMDLAEAAEVSCLSEAFLKKRIDRGELVARKAGTRLLILPMDLQNYLDGLPDARPFARSRVKNASG